MPPRSALPVALLVACTVPVPKVDPPTTPWYATDVTEPTLPTLGDPAFVARIDVGYEIPSFRMPGDLTGDGGPDLLVNDRGRALWLVPGPVTGNIRVEDAAVATFFSSVAGASLFPSHLVPVGDSDGDGREELLIRRVDGIARLDLPVQGDVDVAALPLVLDFEHRFIESEQVIVVAVGDHVWVGGKTVSDAGKGWLFDGPWTGTRTLDDAVLHVFGSAPYDPVDPSRWLVTADQISLLGDLNASGTADIALDYPHAFLDTSLRGDVSITPSQEAAFAIPQSTDYAGIGDVTGDGIDDLLVDGPNGKTGCVVAGPVDRETPGIGSPAQTEDCALVLVDASDGEVRPGPDAWPLGDLDGDGAGEWLLQGDILDESMLQVVRGGVSGTVDIADARLASHPGDFEHLRFNAPIGELDGEPGTDLIVESRLASGEIGWWELHRAIP